MNESLYRYSIYSPTKSFGVAPHFVSGFSESTEGYSSVYKVDKHTADAIIEAGTVEGFKGVVYSPTLWVDTDTQEASHSVEKRLKELELEYVKYDSGNRGWHFGIRRIHSPSHLLPAKDKQWAQANLEGCDTSIYTHLHLFRLPGTLHEKSGRRKTLIERQAGQPLDLRNYELNRRRSNSIFVSNSSSVDVRSVFDSLRIMGNSVPMSSGNRHPTLTKLVYAMNDYSVPADKIRWWAGEVNKMFEEPKSEEELDQIVGSICK